MKIRSRIRAATLLLCSSALLAATWTAPTFANAWQEGKQAIRSFPANVKQGGKELGHAMRDSGRALGHASRDGWYHVRDGFRRDFIQGGAVRGNRVPNRSNTQSADPL